MPPSSIAVTFHGDDASLALHAGDGFGERVAAELLDAERDALLLGVHVK
jgi:hypothetical protein